ncbi:MAG: ABC transporter permease [Thermoguttaceae bacterium]
MYRTLLWKEYRQNFPLLAALFIFVILLQLASTLWLFGNPYRGFMDGGAATMLRIALLVTALYTTGMSAILFCNEHEEKTYSMIRSLPVSRGLLLAGKFSWLFFSSTAFFVVAGIEGFLWDYLVGNAYFDMSNVGEAIGVALGAYALIVLFPICWGMLWTTRTNSQLNSLLGALISASCISWLSFTFAYNYLNDSSYRGFIGLTITVSLAIIAGVTGIVSGYYWFDIWRDKGNPFADWTDRETSADEEAASLSYKPKWEFAALYCQAISQSRNLFMYAILIGVINCTMSFGLVFSGIKDVNSDYTFVIQLILFVSALYGFIFCGSIFSGDQKSGCAFLADRGISPGKIWLSRIAAFGSVYFGVGLALMLTFIFCATYENIGRISEMSALNVIERVINFWTGQFWIMLAMLLGATGLYCIPFICGALVSMLFRSRIISIVCTTTLAWLFIGWCSFLMVYLGVNVEDSRAKLNFSFLWFIVPLLAGILIASRLRIDDWLRRRSIWKSRRPVILSLVAPFVFVFVVLPLYRIYSIPVIDFGYRANPARLEKPISEDSIGFDIQLYIEQMTDQYVVNNQPLYEDNQINRQAAKLAVTRKLINDKNDDSFYPLRFLGYNPGRIHYYNLPRIESDEFKAGNNTDTQLSERDFPYDLAKISPQFLRDGIAFLESTPTNRVSYTTLLKKEFENEYRLVKHGLPAKAYMDWKDPFSTMLRAYLICPWEKARTLRQLAYEFQDQMYLAEKAEEAIYENKGDLRELSQRERDGYFRRERNYSSIFNGPLDMVSPWTGIYFGHVYQTEAGRRADIILLALMLYKKEHGCLPENLNELVTAGILKEVPRVPCIDEPFVYVQHPDGTEQEGNLDYSINKHTPGTPYLWYPTLSYLYVDDGSELEAELKSYGVQRGTYIDLKF